MKKIIITIIFCQILLVSQSFSQTYPRNENPNYMQTRLNEDFNTGTLNSGIWNPSSHGIFELPSHIKILIWVNSDATVKVNQSTGSLDLSMLSSPNYSTTDWDGNPITANFIAGQVATVERYSYGIFECRATLACLRGSFPAFWLHSGMPCTNSINNEIDIVELKYDHDLPTLDNNTFYYPQPCGTDPSGHEFKETPEFYWQIPHTFKCIWTPTRIEFWKDDIKLKEIQNTGQFWYPYLASQVILSQQVVNYENYYAPQYGIITPQTSSFHWVKVREFFLAPEITCPTIICSTGIAIMDVDPAATNISWTLTPSNVFSSATTDTGKIAYITASPTSQGKGKITYSFNMPSGETFTAEKDMWIKGPDVTEVSFDVFRSDGVRATKVGSTFLLCPNTNYQIFLLNSGPVPLSNYNWTVPSAWTQNYIYNNMISVYTNSLPGGQVIVTATNTASGCNNTIKPVTGYMGTNYSCGSYFMSFAPNPAISETTLELSADGEKVVNDKTEWELEVYDQVQSLKEKQTKLKGTQTKINTSGWKDGVYVVRAKIGDEVITEKLVVKH